MAAKKNKITRNTDIILTSSITPIQINASVLPDGTYKNTLQDAGKCTRCNRGIAVNAVFHKHRGNIYGPECITFVRQVEAAVPADDVVRVVQHQFRLRMKHLTLAGMRRKGLIKPASPDTSDQMLMPFMN
jgi:hypothetical protein